MTTILLILVIIGIVFLIIPAQFLIKSPNSFLKTHHLKIDTVKGAILFVSEIKSGHEIERLLAYQILKEISISNPNKYEKRYVWLIHGGVSKEPNSSFKNTTDLISLFSSDKFELIPKNVNNINDPSDSFKVVEDIFAFEASRFGLGEFDVVCDFTGGTKAMSIGMSLACMGKRRLIYSPQDDPIIDNNIFLEIDTKSLLHSAIASE